MLRREILRRTGVALSYTSQLRRRVWLASVTALKLNYNTADRSTSVGLAKREVFGLVDKIGVTLFGFGDADGVQRPENETARVPLVPDSLSRGTTQILVGQVDALIVRLEQGDFDTLGVGDAGLGPRQSSSVFAPLLVSLRAARRIGTCLLDYFGSNGDKVCDLTDDPDIQPQSQIDLLEAQLSAAEATNRLRKRDLQQVLGDVAAELPIEDQDFEIRGDAGDTDDEDEDDDDDFGLAPTELVSADAEWTAFAQQVLSVSAVIDKLPVSVGSQAFADSMTGTIEQLRRSAQTLSRRYAREANDEQIDSWLRSLAALRAAGMLVAEEIELSGDESNTRNAAVQETAKFWQSQFAQQLLAWTIKSSSQESEKSQLALESTQYAERLRALIESSGGNGQVPLPDKNVAEDFIRRKTPRKTREALDMINLYYDLQRSYFRDIASVEWTGDKGLVIGDLVLDAADIDEINLRLVAISNGFGTLKQSVRKPAADADGSKGTDLVLYERAEAIIEKVDEAQKETQARSKLGATRAALFRAVRYFRLVKSVEPLNARTFQRQLFEFVSLTEQKLVDILNQFGGLAATAPERDFVLDEETQAEDAVSRLRRLQEERRRRAQELQQLQSRFRPIGDPIDDARALVSDLKAAARDARGTTELVLASINNFPSAAEDILPVDERREFEDFRRLYQRGSQLLAINDQADAALQRLKTNRPRKDEARKRTAAQLSDLRQQAEEQSVAINEIVRRNQQEFGRFSELSWWRDTAALLEEVLTESIESLSAQLSDGERREIALARAKFQNEELTRIDKESTQIRSSIDKTLADLQKAIRQVTDGNKQLDGIDKRFEKVRNRVDELEEKSTRKLRDAERIIVQAQERLQLVQQLEQTVNDSISAVNQFDAEVKQLDSDSEEGRDAVPQGSDCAGSHSAAIGSRPDTTGAAPRDIPGRADNCRDRGEFGD